MERSIFAISGRCGPTTLRDSDALDLGRLLGVRRLDAALLSVTPDRDQSGVKPPHSKETPGPDLCSSAFICGKEYETMDEMPSNVRIGIRIVGCLVASAVAVIPSVTAAYCAYQIRNFFSNLMPEQLSEEPLTVSSLIVAFGAINKPLVIALCFAALLAIAFAIFIAINPKRRLISVGMPFSFGAPLIGCATAFSLWLAEANILTVLESAYTGTEIGSKLATISMLIVGTYTMALVAVGASFMGSIVSLLRSPQSRGLPLSATRATIWIMGGVLLLVCAGAFFFRISMRAVTS